MQDTGRLYFCQRCSTQVIICSRCDHGQRYCASACAQNARLASLKRAAKKYQSSRAGRFNNAARQRRFRQRHPQKVTHHGSLTPVLRALLKSKPDWPQIVQKLMSISDTFFVITAAVPASLFYARISCKAVNSGDNQWLVWPGIELNNHKEST